MICIVQLVDLLEKSLPHFRYRRPPDMLVRKNKRVNKRHTQGAPMAM